MYRLTLHGDAGGSRAVEVAIATAFVKFVAEVEAIDSHGVYLAQIEGDTGFQRLRGDDNTMVETPATNEPVWTEGVFVVGEVKDGVETRTELING